MRSSTSGELTLIDPETGRTLRVDTGDRGLRTAFDERRGRGSRRRSRARSPALGIRHLRLSPTVRGCPRSRTASPGPRPNRTTRMNFLAPEMLLGLLLVPIAIGFYLWAQRRRSKYAVRFTEPRPARQLAPRRPSWRRHLRADPRPRRDRGAAHRPRPPDDGHAGPARGRHGHPGHGRLGLDARNRRLPPTRLDAATRLRPVVHRPAPRQGRAVGIVSFASEPVTLVAHGRPVAGGQAVDRLLRAARGRRSG